MKSLLLTTLLLGSLNSIATTYQVGSTQLYTTPNELYLANVVQDGDTIEIDSETYSGTACLAKWQANDLYIVGMGAVKPHMKADGQNIGGKGIWIFSADNITVENIEFSEASVTDQNGAGIRLEGMGMTVINCYFHDNENGVLTGNSGGDITILNSEFASNGYGDGYSHNLYIGHVDKLIFKFNYSHHAFIGHNLKSRANENYILYNRIMDEQSGESSRLIDLPNGGFSIVMGNLLMQGNNAPNNNMVGYGLEGITNTLGELYFINNTLVNKRTASCIFVSVAGSTTVSNISNNIFAGTGTNISGTTTTANNNVSDTDIANLYFTDEANYDYHLAPNSPAVDAGNNVSAVNGNSLTPDFQYEHSTNSNARTTVSVIDAGSYEDMSSAAILEFQTDNSVVYPNPFTNSITLKNVILEKSELSIVNAIGQDFTDLVSVDSSENNTIINTANLVSGVYLIRTASFTSIIYKK